MKQVTTLLIVFLLSFFQSTAQVCHPKQELQEAEPDTTSTGSVANVNRDVYYDLNDLSLLAVSASKHVFQFGYGIQAILAMNHRNVPDHLSWFNDRPVHVFDFSTGLGSRSDWLLGFSFGFQKLGTINRSKTYFPGEYAQDVADFGALPLEVQYALKARSYAPQMYTEYRFWNPWKGFSAFARAEMGMTIYRAYMEVSYRDSCDCKKIPVSDWEMSAAFHAGLGLGIQWEYRFIGLKAFAAYQVQTRVNFKERADYETYSFTFDPVHYDFKGGPAASRFAIQESGEEVWKRYNRFYIQLMIYVRFGSR